MFKNISVFSVAVVALSSIGAVASADVIVTDSLASFTAVANSFGQAVVSEDFQEYSGHYDSGTTGGSGATAWVATGAGGFDASGGVFSTTLPAEAFTFTFTSGDVYAIGGNFFNRDADFTALPSVIRLTTSAGVSYVHFAGGADSFGGFVSTSGAIQSIAFIPYGSTAGAYGAVSNLSFGVIPAPGAVALLGLGGLIGRRRR